MKLETTNLFSQQKVFLETFQKSGLPTRKTERWKFTPIANYISKEWQQANEVPLSSTELPFGHAVTFVGSENVSSQSQNCKIEKLNENQIESFFKQRSQSPSWQNDDSLFFLHLAKLKAFYRVSYSGSEPLYLSHNLTGGEENYGLIFDIQGDATIIEEFSSTGANSFLQTSRFINLGKNQKINHILINQEKEGDVNQVWTNADLEESNSSYHLLQMALTSSLVRSNPFITLNSSNTYSTADSFYFLNDNAHYDFFSKTLHNKPETRSTQTVQGLLHGESKLAFTGNINIPKNSQKVEADQFNKNLIIGNQAQAFGQPQLEIFADDVKCSHGSTTGQLDHEELFYLQSRGISQTKAREMMMKAYGQSLIKTVDHPEAKLYLTEILNNKLRELQNGN